MLCEHPHKLVGCIQRSNPMHIPLRLPMPASHPDLLLSNEWPFKQRKKSYGIFQNKKAVSDYSHVYIKIHSIGWIGNCCPCKAEDLAWFSKAQKHREDEATSSPPMPFFHRESPSFSPNGTNMKPCFLLELQQEGGQKDLWKYYIPYHYIRHLYVSAVTFWELLC